MLRNARIGGSVTMIVACAFVGVLLGGCPQTASKGIEAGTYIGTGPATFSASTGEVETRMVGKTVVVTGDGRVVVDGADYSAGNIVRTETGTVSLRLDDVNDVFSSSGSIVIQFSTVLDNAGSPSLSGVGSITLMKIDDQTIEFTEQVFVATNETGIFFSLEQTHVATLRR